MIRLVVTGGTFSSDFPVVRAVQEFRKVPEDAFITRIAPQGDEFMYSTYLGSSADDRGYGVVITGSGSAFVTGGTHASDFPTVPRDDFIGGWEAFVSVITDGKQMIQFSAPARTVHEYAGTIALTVKRSSSTGTASRSTPRCG